MSAETSEWLNTYQLIGYTDPSYGRGNAWHDNKALRTQLGIEDNHYSHAIPVEDVLRRLYNWKAVEAEIVIRAKDDSGRIIESVDQDRKAIVRSDDPSTVFNVFKSGYQIHQYEQWLLKDVGNLLDDDLNIGTAGLLRRGGKSYVTLELPETIKTPSGFDIRPHLLACTSHDGTLSTTYQLVTTIVVCDNTLAGALGEQTPQVKVRHSKHSIGRLQTVREALSLVHEYTDDLTIELERLAVQQVTDNEFQAIIDHLVPVTLGEEVRPQVQARAQNKQELIRSIYKTDKRVSAWAGTSLGVLQAFNTYNHWFAGSDKNRDERNKLNTVTGKSEANDRVVLDAIKNLVFA
jgi:phage/plasmid-like protein (TIGR03299 family)